MQIDEDREGAVRQHCFFELPTYHELSKKNIHASQDFSCEDLICI